MYEAGQKPTKELLDVAKTVPGKGNGRTNMRYGRPDQFSRPKIGGYNNGGSSMNNGSRPGGLVSGMQNMGRGWINQNQGAGGSTGFTPRDYQKPFNRYSTPQQQGGDDKSPRASVEGGFRKNPEYQNRNNGFQQQQQQTTPGGGYQGGEYKKNFGAQNEGGYKPRNSFVKPDFNGNPRGQFNAGDKPRFQSNYLGNNPRPPFNSGGNPRFANSGDRQNEFGGAPKFNKFEGGGHKGGYERSAQQQEKDSDIFQGVKSFTPQSGGRGHYNPNSGNRYGDHQNASLESHSQPPPQQFVAADAIDGQFDSNMIPGYRMVPNGPAFPAAYGE